MSFTRSGLSAFLVDSNILIYMFDPRDHAKQRRALEVLDFLVSRRSAVLSVQCLTEFFRAVCWRLPDPLSHGEALAEVEDLTLACRVLPLTAPAVLEGCRGCDAHNLSFWDALIWAVTKLNGIPYVLSEDNEHGRVIEGVRFLNPFHPDFDLSLLESTQ